MDSLLENYLEFLSEAPINKAWIVPIVNMFKRQKLLVKSTSELSALRNRLANRLVNATGLSLPEAMKHLM